MVLDGNAGPPVTYQQLGYLTNLTNLTSLTNLTNPGNRSRLPLYGQPSATRRGRWSYYTLVDGLKLPLVQRGRDCLDEVACEELSDGDTVSVGEEDGLLWQVKLYRRDVVFTAP